MAPLSAKVLSQQINGEETAIDMNPFDPFRKKGLKSI